MIMLGMGRMVISVEIYLGHWDQFADGCRAVSSTLNETVNKWIAFLCEGEERMTEHDVTYGPEIVMQARRIVMIVSGKEKAETLKQAVQGEITVRVPSSIVKMHPDFTIIADEDALSLLK